MEKEQEEHNTADVASFIGDADSREYVIMSIDKQLFGISVYSVRDILAPQKITSIPLAPREVAGSLNLRGRIVTAIDLRVILNLGSTSPEDYKKSMSIVVENNGELYSLVVDSVGEVLTLKLTDIVTNPENLSAKWQDLSVGIFPQKDNLIVILDVDKIVGVNNESQG